MFHQLNRHGLGLSSSFLVQIHFFLLFTLIPNLLSIKHSISQQMPSFVGLVVSVPLCLRVSRVRSRSVGLRILLLFPFLFSHIFLNTFFVRVSLVFGCGLGKKKDEENTLLLVQSQNYHKILLVPGPLNKSFLFSFRSVLFDILSTDR